MLRQAAEPSDGKETKKHPAIFEKRLPRVQVLTQVKSLSVFASNVISLWLLLFSYHQLYSLLNSISIGQDSNWLFYQFYIKLLI